MIGIAAQERSQHGRGDAQIDARHLFTDHIHIEGAAAETAAVFGDEQELNAQLIRAAHMPDDLQRAFVAVIQFPDYFVRQAFLGKISERLHA